MPRKRLELPKKEVKRKWTEEALQCAIADIRAKRKTPYAASKFYGIPKTSLMRNLSKLPADTEVKLPVMGRPTILGAKVERELVKYLLEMENRFFGLTRGDLKRFAYNLCMKKNIPHPFSSTKKEAGRGWVDLFLRRHRKELSIRQATGTSKARILGFKKEAIDRFFNVVNAEYIKYKFPAHRIYNCDETGISVVPSKTPRVISAKGKRQIGVLTAAERGSLITLVTCFNANGDFVPPLIIFPRKTANPLLMKHAPAGSIAGFHPSGWIQMNLFTTWFKHFIDFTKPSAANPVLLFLDGHYTHTRNPDVIELALQNHVIIISLPPHCSHKIQPLDKTFMGPFKINYSEAIRQFQNRTQRTVTLWDVAELLNEAYTKSRIPEYGINGFRTTGIYPLNREIFQETDYLETKYRLPRK